MKVVIQGIETCGIISDLAREMMAQGHEVVTIADHHRFYKSDYNFRLSHFLHDYSGSLPLPLHLGLTAAKLLKRTSNSIYTSVSTPLRERICLNTDLYVQVWSGGQREFSLLRRLRKKRTKIATLFMGSEVRYYPCFRQQFGEQDWDFPKEYRSTLYDKLLKLRVHERYADAVFSVPDQMGLALRPYHHLLVPIRYDGIEFNLPDRARPLVLHVPTNEGVKGSRVIESALKQLKDEGCEFDYLPLKNIPHESLLNVLSAADVLVDELLLHGPGWLGFEAMAAGCAVATRHLKDSPPIFRPPVLSINRRSVLRQLRLLLNDRRLRRELAHQGRQYVEQNNGISNVVEHLISRTINGKGQEDHHPSFYHRFEPTTEEERHAIRLTTKIVEHEPWYRNSQVDSIPCLLAAS